MPSGGFANAVIGADEGLTSYLQQQQQRAQQQQEAQLRQQQIKQQAMAYAAALQSRSAQGASNVQVPGLGQPPPGQQQQPPQPLPQPQGAGIMAPPPPQPPPQQAGGAAGGPSPSGGGPSLPQMQAGPQQVFSKIIGSPVQISSAKRSPEHNAAVGGSPTSEHLQGTAWDIVVPGGRNAAAIQKLVAAGFPFDQIIDEGSHVHVGIGGKMRGEVIVGGKKIPADAPAAAQTGAEPQTPSDATQTPNAAPGGSGGQESAADQFSPERMEYMREQITDAIKKKNPDLDDATTSEAVDDFIGSLTKMRQLMAPQAAVVVQQERAQTSERNTDAHIGAQERGQDMAATGRQASLQAAADREHVAITARAAAQDKALAASKAKFEEGQTNIESRLKERLGANWATSATGQASRQLKASRQRITDQMNAYKSSKGGVVPDGDKQWDALTKQLDQVDAQQANLLKNAGADKPDVVRHFGADGSLR
jgi:hypothetical protein